MTSVIDQRQPDRPKVWVFYHVFHPSSNVSARHLSDLAEGLAERGWEVTAMPANRDYPDGKNQFPLRDRWHGVAIRRIWRPNFHQSRNLGRIANAAWMITVWALQALTFGRRRPDVVIIGTDPILSVLTAIPWRLTRPWVRIAHWGFDLYPEAPIADGMMSPRSPLVWILRRLLRWAYGACDSIIDIGPCMRQCLAAYQSSAHVQTLTPWALVEPAAPIVPDAAVRRELFGDARLGLLYSGTFGRAHSYQEFLDLARALRDVPIAFCFAGRGNRTDQLRQAITPDDRNIRFAGFASEAELEKRLGAADIHMASLRPEWTGSVVPSKFFGSLAAGRPVLFAGSRDSALAKWIEEFQVGWIVDASTVQQVATTLRQLVDDSSAIIAMRQRCHAVYQQTFSRNQVIDRWDQTLRSLLAPQRRRT